MLQLQCSGQTDHPDLKMMMTRFLIVIGFFLMLWVPIVYASEERLIDERRVLALFFERNLGLIAAQYQINTAEAAELIAAALPNPVVTFGSNELAGDWSPRPSSAGGRGMGFNVAVSQLLITHGKRELKMESSRLGREAFEVDFRDSVRILTNTVRHAFYNLLFAQKNLEVARENFQRYQELIKANRLRLKAGDIAEADLMRIEVESYKANSDADNAAAALWAARSELATLLSWPDDSMNFIVEDRWPDGIAAYLGRQEDSLVTQAFENRPDLQSQKIRATQAERELELARRLIVPDVTVSAGYVQDAGNIYMDSGFVNISAPIPAFYQFKGETDHAAANLNQQRLQLEQLRNEVRNEVISTRAVLRSAHAIAERFQKEVLRRLEVVRSSSELAYSQGAISLIALIDAERSYKSMMLDYYSALNNRTLAYSDLLKALGEGRAK